MKTADALSILDIDHKAGPAQVKNAYRKAAFRTHPDSGGNDEEFKSVQAAYQHLIENGTTPSGLYMGRVPIADIREDLRDFAVSLFRERGAGRKKYHTEKEKQDMLERTFQHYVKDGLTAVGAWVFNVHGHVMQKRGVPDLYIAHPLWTGWIELKYESRELQTIQRAHLNSLLMLTVPAFVLRLQGGILSAEHDDGMGAETMYLEDFVQHQIKRDNGEVLLRFLNKATKNLAISLGQDIGMYSWQGSLRTQVHIPAGKKVMDVFA